jgi:hypothetical protein
MRSFPSSKGNPHFRQVIRKFFLGQFVAGSLQKLPYTPYQHTYYDYEVFASKNVTHNKGVDTVENWRGYRERKGRL